MSTDPAHDPEDIEGDLKETQRGPVDRSTGGDRTPTGRVVPDPTTQKPDDHDRDETAERD